MKFFNRKKNQSSSSIIRKSDNTKRQHQDRRAALPINTLLDGYRLGKVIGRGSFSLVYSAVEVATGRELVIKEYFPKHFAKRVSGDRIVPRHSGNDVTIDARKELIFQNGLKQFYREALALNNIEHPNVLSTHNFFLANNSAYLVSLNQKGRDLKWFLDTHPSSLGHCLILKVFLPTLSALNFLHKAKLLHLDIKPANILLQPDGQSLLLDFGASQPMDSSKRINKYQTLTHGFAPPEQYEKDRQLGPWTDIYAIAASLYYCIMHKAPPRSKDNEETAELCLKKYAGHYHPNLIDAINRGLSHDESLRFRSVDAFANSILSGSKWESLVEYEREILDYDRYASSAKQSLNKLIQYAA